MEIGFLKSTTIEKLEIKDLPEDKICRDQNFSDFQNSNSYKLLSAGINA